MIEAHRFDGKPETPACYRRIASGVPGADMTVLDMVDNVTAHRSARTWSAREVLETKRTWTDAEVIALLVELFDGDDDN